MCLHYICELIKARVKPEAAAVAELGHTGLVGRLFADSMDEARRKNIENSLKEKVVPKNHIQQNIQRMRKMQKESREKRSQVVKKILNSSGFYFYDLDIPNTSESPVAIRKIFKR